MSQHLPGVVLMIYILAMSRCPIMLIHATPTFTLVAKTSSNKQFQPTI